MSPWLYPMLSGAVAMASFVAALLFLRYWRRSRDRLFLYFCTAFLIDAAVRFVQVLATARGEDDALIYLPRLASYALIAWAIVDKNRRAGR